jgi:hypothetical protein
MSFFRSELLFVMLVRCVLSVVEDLKYRGPEYLLKNGTIGYLSLGLALELGCRGSQNKPVLLEDAEVGSITSLAVTCR